MKVKQTKLGRTFAVRLERNDEVIVSLKEFCITNGIEGGLVYGIGAVSYAKIYSVKNNEQFSTIEKEFSEPMELISALGNIGFLGGKPFIHLHVLLGKSDKSTLAGHLLDAKISFTGEFFIVETDRLEKVKEDGLALFKF